MSRKSVPRLIIHDNAKTFSSIEVKRFLANNLVQQRFILPASPWWGGFYERLVRSVKLSLRKTLGRSLLRYEELETVLCRVESVINSRPLTYVSSDDLHEPLTPFHMLFGRNITLTQDKVVIADQERGNVTKRLTYLQKLLDCYWKRFSSTYLNELRQQHLYRKDNPNRTVVPPRVGDVVIIRDDSPLPRQKWRLGKIEELVRGNDKMIRGVKLTVAAPDGSQNICHRPVQKIVPFEIVEDSLECEKPENVNHLKEVRPIRKAALNGQCLRRLKAKFVD